MNFRATRNRANPQTELVNHLYNKYLSDLENVEENFLVQFLMRRAVLWERTLFFYCLRIQVHVPICDADTICVFWRFLHFTFPSNEKSQFSNYFSSAAFAFTSISKPPLICQANEILGSRLLHLLRNSKRLCEMSKFLRFLILFQTLG